jgi:hypothetical protein
MRGLSQCTIARVTMRATLTGTLAALNVHGRPLPIDQIEFGDA